MKQIVFNVGGALSTYIEFDGKTLLVDIGQQSDVFNPVTDFLLPLYRERDARRYYTPMAIGGWNVPTISERYGYNIIKFPIDQLLISHPHKDHISAIEDFDKYFYPKLLIASNNSNGIPQEHRINWSKVGNENDSSIIKLRDMLKWSIPQCLTQDQNEFICYIPPEEVENDYLLSSESYCNNISIVVFLIINGYRVFLPGDIQKEGMKRIIDSNPRLRSLLMGGVDVLIAPHHGLRSSFSEHLFYNMKNQKTRSINIVSEKVSKKGEAREVDTRYSRSDYCKGENNLSEGNRFNIHYQIKTSRGHIFIDYTQKYNPTFKICKDINEAIALFL